MEKPQSGCTSQCNLEQWFPQCGPQIPVDPWQFPVDTWIHCRDGYCEVYCLWNWRNDVLL